MYLLYLHFRQSCQRFQYKSKSLSVPSVPKSLFSLREKNDLLNGLSFGAKVVIFPQNEASLPCVCWCELLRYSLSGVYEAGLTCVNITSSAKLHAVSHHKCRDVPWCVLPGVKRRLVFTELLQPALTSYCFIISSGRMMCSGSTARCEETLCRTKGSAGSPILSHVMPMSLRMLLSTV